MPTPEYGAADFARILSTKKDAAVSALNAQQKANENHFRQRNTDVLEKLYERVWKLKGPLIIEQAPALAAPAQSSPP